MSPPTKKKKNSPNESDILCSWLRYEISLLNKLILRNKDQHRGSFFMISVLKSLRLLKKLDSKFLIGKRSSDLSNLHNSSEFNDIYKITLDSIMNSCLHLSRIHVHRYFAPFSSTLIAIFSRLLLLVIKIPNCFKFPE